MSKRVVAFGAGRRNGNTEVFIKAALMEIEKAGIEVEYIRLNECDLKACKDCLNKVCMKKTPDDCILKDDAFWLKEKYLDSDGYLFGAPVWSLSPAGITTVFRDRVFGPQMDLASWEMRGAPEWAKGRGKPRPGCLISVGGARSEHWTSLGLPTLYTTTFSAQINVIDHMNVTEVADMGAAVLRPDLIERAEELGRNLAYAVLHPEEEPHWMGPDTPTTCPGCHCNMMIYKPDRDYMECAICGRRGLISINDGEVSVIFLENDPDDRLRMEGKATHQREIQNVKDIVYAPKKDLIDERWQKYKDYESCVVKPPRKKA